MSGQPCSMTIRPGGCRGVRVSGVAMGVSGLRLASQQPLCVQGCHPSPLCLAQGPSAVLTGGRWVRGARYRVASSRRLSQTEVTVWSALHVPGDVSGMTHLFAVQPADARRALPGACLRRKVVSSRQDASDTTRAVKAPRPWPLVALVGVVA